MAEKIVGKVKGFEGDLKTLFLASVAKGFLEPALAGVIGNATIVSGGIKLACGYMLPKVFGHNQITDILTAALMIDGVEDIVHTLLTSSGIVQGVMGQSVMSQGEVL